MRNFIFLIAVFFCFANCRGKDTSPVLLKLPEKVGTLQRVNAVRGTAANKFMYRMHGKMTGTHTSIIGYYGNSDNKNVLYVSSFESIESAENALIKMASKIKKGAAGFTPATIEQINELRVYQTSGMGLKHFFYQSGRFWSGGRLNRTKLIKHFKTSTLLNLENNHVYYYTRKSIKNG